jgi:hypothetical protein
MPVTFDVIFHDLEECVGDRVVDLGHGHDRWALYVRAIELGGCSRVLFEIVPHEPNVNIALGLVLRMIETEPDATRALWVSQLRDTKSRAYAERRMLDLRILEDPRLLDSLLEGGPDWSEWLQLRLAMASNEVSVLRWLSQNGSTGRIRAHAAQRMEAMEN